MISTDLYRVLHIAGAFWVFMALGAVTLHALTGGERKNNPARALIAASHGTGLVLLIVGGFALLARLGIHWPLPLWLWGKIVLWLVLAASLTFIYRIPKRAKQLWWSFMLIGMAAAFLGAFKPGM